MGLQWWTRTQQSPGQKLLLDWVCIVGALCCLAGLAFEAVGNGRARLATASAAFFGLFLFVQFTPLAYLP
jgi:hypothetical protein